MRMPFIAAIMTLALWAAAGTGAVPAFLPAWFAPIWRQEKPTIAVRVDSVQVVAAVRDDKGRIRDDLRKEDFILEEEGKPVEIEYFGRETDVPLTVGLLVDTSMSQMQVLQQAKSATLQFLRQVLRPAQDLAFLISFDIDAELLQGLTNDLVSLQRALQDARHPIAQGRPQFGTVLYDAIFLAANEVLRDQAGRKAIVLMSDGADYGSITDLDAALEEAQRADTVIYSMYYATPSRAAIALGRRGGGRMPRVIRAAPDGKKILKKLSEETGGRMFEITGKLTVTEIFRQIQEELRSQYILGFTPPTGFASKAFRRITLRAKDKRLKVFCRSGYYPQPNPKGRP
jgi:VWFA-related protein